MYQSENKKYIFFPFFSCSLYVYAWAYVYIYGCYTPRCMLHGCAFSCSPDKNNSYMCTSCFNWWGHVEKNIWYFYRSSLACTCTATGHSELDFDVNRPSPYTIHNIQNFADNPWSTLSTKINVKQIDYATHPLTGKHWALVTLFSNWGASSCPGNGVTSFGKNPG